MNQSIRIMLKIARLMLPGLLALLLAACFAPSPAPAAAKKAVKQKTVSKARSAESTKKRVCLWLLWVKDKGLKAKAEAAMDKGQPFAVVAHNLSALGAKYAKSNLDCLQMSSLDPILLKQAKGLGMGEISKPFTWAEGFAWVMYTTDRYRRKGRKFYQERKFAQAEKEFMKDLNLHPTSAAIWQLVAMCRAAQGNREGSLKAMDQALTWDPDNPSLLQDKATTLVYLGRPELALPLYKRASRLAPKNPLIMSNQAWALAKLNKDLELAEKLASRAVLLRPGSGHFLSVLGQVQQARGEHDKALANLEKAAGLDPDLPGIKEAIRQSRLALGLAAKETPAPPKPVAKAETKEPPKAGPEKPATEKPAAAKKAPAKPEPEEQVLRTRVTAKSQGSLLLPGLTKTKAGDKKPKKSKPAKAAPKPATVKAKPEEKRPAQAKPEPAQGEVVLIQVASYPALKSAKKEAAAWRLIGYRAYIDSYRNPDGKTWRRVLLGPYPSAEVAKAQVNQLESNRLIQGYRLIYRPKDWRPNGK